MPEHDRPRVDRHLPVDAVARPGDPPVGHPQPPPGRAGVEQHGHHLEADQRGGGGRLPLGLRSARSARSARGAVADGAHLRRHPRRHPHDLGQRPAHQVGRVGRPLVTLEHGHHQPRRLGCGERQRRQPQAVPDLIPAVGAADRLDRQLGLAQDRHVAAGGPLGDPEALAQAGGGDAGDVLDRLEGEQRAGGRAHVVRHPATSSLAPGSGVCGSRMSGLHATLTRHGEP